MYLVLTASAAAASPALVRCAAIEEAQSRLACYDALAGRAASPQGSAPAAARLTAPAPRLSNPVGPSAVEPAAVATQAAATDPSNPDNFGLTTAQLKQAPAGPSSISATVASFGGSADGKGSVWLDNGQHWLFLDQGANLRSGDAVSIKRATLGSYLMTTPSRRSFRVKRTQ